MSQDTFLLKYCSATTPIRYRPRSGTRGKKKLKYKYFVKNRVGNRIEVCRAAFINILGITKHRVEGHLFTLRRKDVTYPRRLEEVTEKKRNTSTKLKQLLRS